jgi:hypothetical protein
MTSRPVRHRAWTLPAAVQRHRRFRPPIFTPPPVTQRLNRLGSDVVAELGQRRLDSIGCPHCDSRDVVHRGQASALPRYRCKGCQRSSPEGQRRQLQGCRQLCVLWKRSMGKVEPPGDDTGLSTTLVRQPGGLAQNLVARPQPAAGIGPARAGILTYQSKEPDAGPARPVL